VSAQVDRLTRLSRDLRKLAELESQPLDLQDVDMGALIRETVEVAREGPGMAGRVVSVALPNVPWPLPLIPGDSDLLALAFHNLIDNALKYSHPGDAVEVRAYEDGEWCVIEVADEGVGISEEDLPRVGEELYRGRAARGTPGSGLGIALARAVVTRHGGSLLVRSRENEGTVVTVRLPLRGPS